MTTDNSSAPAWLSYSVLGAATIVSGVGWFFSGQWIDGNDPFAKAGLAVLRTILTLLPAMAGFVVATWRQKRVEQQIAGKLDELRTQMEQFVRLQSVQNELETVDRLAKVARSAVIQTGSSASELFLAIASVPDAAAKDLLLERYRHHTNGLVTVLTAVSEQLTESGRKIAEDLTADERIDIVERADRNVERGLAYAEKVIQTRGIGDGVTQLKMSVEKAQNLQQEISSTVGQIQGQLKSLDSQGVSQ